jgi:hypothetical protein
MGHNADLRDACECPPESFRADFHVQHDFALEQGKGNPQQEALALGVLDVLHKKSSPSFAATKKKALLHLNTHIVDVLEGD